MEQGSGVDQGLYRQEFEHDSCGVGIVANIKGRSSHEIVRRAVEVLERMEHRGAESADNKTGDGAGILMHIPHAYYLDLYPTLPNPGEYATGLVFLPGSDPTIHDKFIHIMEQSIPAQNLRLLFWREVPVDRSSAGPIALKSIPVIRQLFIAPAEGCQDFPVALYVYRKKVEKLIRSSMLPQAHACHILSLSEKTIVYKGMLMSHQLRLFFPELEDPRVATAAALVHSRFSTNTFPAWELAQPFRMIAHNGEINTISGNRAWMAAQESLMQTLRITALPEVFPVIEPGKSDSASFDNVLELLVLSGRPLPHALMMMIPESFNEKNPIPEALRSFYTYSACLMEPWDGPASMAFFDGRYIGGTLDRNGLRPARYVVTKDHLLIMASESGVQEFHPSEIVKSGRLMPGKLLLVDLQEGRIIPDDEVKRSICSSRPFTQWVSEQMLYLKDLPRIPENQRCPDSLGKTLPLIEHMNGYTQEDRDKTLLVMALSGQEPTSSMGTDTPLAVLSGKKQLLFSYFKQVFAQVTNPPMDSIREELVMSLTGFVGKHHNLLEDTHEHCRKLRIFNPLLSNEDLARIKAIHDPAFSSCTIDATFLVAAVCTDGRTELEHGLDRLIDNVTKEIDRGKTCIILSDRAYIDNPQSLCPIPSLLAIGAVHQAMIRNGRRLRCVLICESAEPREVMHYALLFGFGADLIVPYGAYAALADLSTTRLELKKLSFEQAEKNYQKGISKALLKIMAKMGISTLRSYRGAQIFEALGLGDEIVEKCFTGCQSRIGGMGFKELQQEVLSFHTDALEYADNPFLDVSGQYSWRKDGEAHAWNPDTIRLLQWAVRDGDYGKFKEFTAASDALNGTPHVLRGSLDFSQDALLHPIPLDQVESIESIMARFTTGAMSFGSISKEAHETIAAAMNSIHCRSNSGEGGEDPERFNTQPDGRLTRGAIKQVASGRFGVTSNYLAHADEIQIKISQGAKPGEGGQLPGHKTDAIIAKTRHATQGVTLISPPPHHDIYSIEDLAELILDLRSANPNARISVKLVSETGVGTVAAGVAKAHADSITISGYDGGTGASPLSSIRYAGLPWEIGLSETHQTLVLNGLRGRVRLMTDGQLKSGRDIIIAAMLGAEEFGFGTSVLIALGCVMMRKCHANTCPMGIATQDPNLRKRFSGREHHLVNFFKFLAQETRELLSMLGAPTLESIIGHPELLCQNRKVAGKAGTLNLSSITNFVHPCGMDRFNTMPKFELRETILNQRLVSRSLLALRNKVPVTFGLPIRNTDRAVGATLSYEVSKRYEEEGLPENFITVDFSGTAGQSFGAFLAKGITFRLHGDANDYLGKGLSGGRIVVMLPEGSLLTSHEHIIAGNTILYGATSGELYVAGATGERFCVRNSGASAVVEGTGDHCAEYMTGGTLVVLGEVGRNFAAGMSGGIAYVLDRKGDLEFKLNKGMVELSRLDNEEDEQAVKHLIRQHVYWTNSTYANEILTHWQTERHLFVKVLPVEYKRALQQMKLAELDRKLNAIRDQEDIAARA